MGSFYNMSSSRPASVLCLILFVSIFNVLVSAEDIYITREEANDLLERQTTDGSTWWFANIKRQGTIPYGSNASYVLFRNVKDYGAVGNGVTNDTAAINAAFADGNRCAGQYNPTNPCQSSTTTPALVYFPPGTYIITSPIIMFYNTLMFGDALNIPTIKAHPSFFGIGLLDSDVYYPGGASWYANQNNFYRQVRNFILDITAMGLGGGACIHWQVAQATSLQNIVMNMRQDGGTNNKQQGIFMDNGSGGFMRDLVFNGGGIGFFLGNQQFTSTNLTFNNCRTAIYMNWDWLWSFKYITVNNCSIGINLAEQSTPSLGSAFLTDSIFTNVNQAIVTNFNCSANPEPSAGTLVIGNVDFRGANSAISYPNGTVILAGGSIVSSWIQGESYSAFYGPEVFATHGNLTCYVPMANQVCIQQSVNPPPIPSGLRNSAGGFVDRGKPTYDSYPVSAFISAKSNGCAGDGITDDTACLQSLFNNVNSNQVAYLDHGAYVVTSTITVPAGIKILGEAWPYIMVSAGAGNFADPSNPQPVLQIGHPGEAGSLEMQDIIFECLGATPGAIIVEWNLAGNAPASAGMWDVHWRIGGSAGTHLESNICSKNPSIQITTPNPKCYGAWLLMHVTSTGSIYMENNWGWVADHELDMTDYNQLNIWNGRGLLVESVQPSWIVGGSFEHSQLYNYQVANAQNLYMSHIQSETAYMQTNPRANVAFQANPAYDDPTFQYCFQDICYKTYGLRIYNSTYVFIYGAGLYSFFQNYDSTCLLTASCQEVPVSFEESEAIYLFGLYTIGSQSMVQVDGMDLAPDGANINTFGESVAVFEFP